MISEKVKKWYKFYWGPKLGFKLRIFVNVRAQDLTMLLQGKDQLIHEKWDIEKQLCTLPWCKQSDNWRSFLTAIKTLSDEVSAQFSDFRLLETKLRLFSPFDVDEKVPENFQV